MLGGLITSGPGWEWVFAVNVPIGLAGAALAGRLLPGADERPTRGREGWTCPAR